MNSIWIAFLVGMGGAVGTLLRYGIVRLTRDSRKPAFYGTLIVNLVGSFVIGMFIGFQFEQEHIEAYAFAGVGILGGFTTYSTLNVQKASMVAEGSKRTLAYYLVATYAGGIVFTAFGVGLGYVIHT